MKAKSILALLLSFTLCLALCDAKTIPKDHFMKNSRSEIGVVVTAADHQSVVSLQLAEVRLNNEFVVILTDNHLADLKEMKIVIAEYHATYLEQENFYNKFISRIHDRGRPQKGFAKLNVPLSMHRYNC